MDRDARTRRLLEARRLNTAKKRARTLRLVKQMVANGDRVTFASVAKRAVVSDWFVRNSPDVRGAIEEATTLQQATGLPDRRTTRHTPSTEGLRADLLLAREEIRDLRRERDQLRARVQDSLADHLGEGSRQELVDRVTALVTERDLGLADNQALTAQIGTLTSDLRDARDELAAARKANARILHEVPRPIS